MVKKKTDDQPDLGAGLEPLTDEEMDQEEEAQEAPQRPQAAPRATEDDAPTKDSGPEVSGALEAELDADEVPEALRPAVVLSVRALTEAMRRYEELISTVRKVAIRSTKSQDWIDQGGGNLFLQGFGAERIMAGIPARWRLEPMAIHRMDHEGEKIPYSFVVTGNAELQLPGLPVVRLEGVMHVRGCGDWFTQRALKQGTTVDPMEVRRATLTGWERRCVTQLLGVRGLTRDDLVPIMGTEWVSKIRIVERQSSKSFPDAGQESDADKRAAPEHHKLVWKALMALVPPSHRQLWPYLLAYATIDRRPEDKVAGRGRFKPKRSVLALTPTGAKFAADQLGRIPKETVALQVACDEAAKEAGLPAINVEQELKK